MLLTRLRILALLEILKWRQHCPGFNRNLKRSFVRILELVNIFRQIPRCFAGASF